MPHVPGDQSSTHGVHIKVEEENLLHKVNPLTTTCIHLLKYAYITRGIYMHYFSVFKKEMEKQLKKIP